jgi:hypothetical protein
MSGNAIGRGCRTKSQHRDRWAIYEELPRELRDKLKIAKDNLCARCFRNELRRSGLKWVLAQLDMGRRARPERRGREVVYVLTESLRP